MSETTEQRGASHLTPITACFSATSPAISGFDPSAFAHHYFADADPADLAARPPEHWCVALREHFCLGQHFMGGAAKLQISTAKIASGATGSRTVISCINEDMPFLVDSLAMEITRQGLATHLVVHPLFAVTRDRAGILKSIAPAAPGQKLESWIHIEIERVSDSRRIAALEAGLSRVLADVRVAVTDWPPMQAALAATIAALVSCPPSPETEEARAFLAWMADHHFTLLGARDYTYSADSALTVVAKSGLGILRAADSVADALPVLASAPATPHVLRLTKATARATVHRAGYLDLVAVASFDATGRAIGERRFVGLYTSNTYHADPQGIPLLREKTAAVLRRAGFPANSHAGKNLASIMQALPRDELFQMHEDELFSTAIGILHLGERPKTRVFIRPDAFLRFYSCLIYLPRENYNTELRVKLQAILMHALAGVSIEFNVQLSESVLARIHMLVRVTPAAAAAADTQGLEAEIVRACHRWEDGVFAHLTATVGDEIALAARQEFVLPFPAGYRETVTPAQAVADFAIARTLTTDNNFAVALSQVAPHTLRLRLYAIDHTESRIALSTTLPMIENMGVKVHSERAYVMARHTKPAIQLHDFLLHYAGEIGDLSKIQTKFEAAFSAVWRGHVESDGFNRLTLAACLTHDEIIVLRTYAKYLKQTGFTFSQSYIEQTLARHVEITGALVAFFHRRFDPAAEQDRTNALTIAVSAIETQLSAVTHADEDRILRRFLAVIAASLRTNFYQVTAEGKRKTYLSIKFASTKVPELPEPKPLFEIFVYSPRVEGIHLRGGKVARGGLRWSDRPEDFRTEVLALVKAQMVKNAMIVPVGSKGGFVVKAPTATTDREATLAEGIACYKIFLSGLLDITDNIVQGIVVPPKNVVRHDEDDPYLVVAADKGTATFSDYANALSLAYGHWLGDAFASGGSVGYDHKKMGITARGAWESVKRHFRELGINTQTTDFTVAGIGDMSGDVFGNAMLLSPHIRLVAAFDHRHIFLDPTPDCARTLAERKRLFVLPRSSWDDFDKSKISNGGAVFSRSAKSIALTNEVKAALAIDPQITSMTPAELMRAILKAPVDLFYNGGIGTYVKAGTQSHSDVGDRANDAIRIDATALRCKVVAEGGNLGLTQLARIEAAQHGVRLYSDAIDNSAGVDCSDHEVNIKILVSSLITTGVLPIEKRDALLAEMTDEVGLLVLRDNIAQTQSLSVSGVRGERLLDAQLSFMRAEEKAGRLNRRVEYLPTDDEINERRAKKQGLTAPERAVLLAYSKMALYGELLHADLIDDAYVARALTDYFPNALRERYRAVMPLHPLRREIIATQLTNSTIDRAGSVFVHRMMADTGASAADVVRCFILARDVYEIPPLWAEIASLDNKTSAATQYDMLIDLGRLIVRATLWFLRRRAERMPIADVLAFFAPGVSAVAKSLPQVLSADDLAHVAAREAWLAALAVPPALAAGIARLDAMYAVLDIVELAAESKREVALVATLYFDLVGKLNLRWLAAQITKLPSDTQWQAMARAAMRDDLANLQRQLVARVLALSPAIAEAPALVQAWEANQQLALKRMRDVMIELSGARETDLAMLSVLLRELRVLT